MHATACFSLHFHPLFGYFMKFKFTKRAQPMPAFDSAIINEIGLIVVLG